MRLYIDESGDAGLRLERPGTSPHFVVAGVLVDDDAAWEACDAGLRAFKARRAAGRREFRFNQCDATLRREYLEAAVGLPWRYLAVALNKSRLSGSVVREPDALMKYAIRLLIGNAMAFLDDAVLVFDATGSRDFRRTMTPYCKERSERPDGSEGIKRVLAQASHTDAMLQLADMVAGAVARSFKPSAKDAAVYRTVIRRRELGVQFWPE